jgi:hypothetical protein
MKWVLLILFASCGEHTVPPVLDFSEKFNSQEEVRLEQFIEDVDELEKINGMLSFSPEGTARVPIEIEFSNRPNFNELIFKMLTTKRTEDNFNEWSRIRFKTPQNIPPLKGSLVLNLNFISLPQKNPSSLWLVDGLNKRKLSQWNSFLKITLTAKELEDILKGPAYLALFNEWIEEKGDIITKRTYRVHYSDGQENKVYYVSKLLPYQDFVRFIDIVNFQNLTHEDPFFLHGYSNEEQWWNRELNESKKVLIKASRDRIIHAYQNNLSSYKNILDRENGKAKQSLKIKKTKEGKFYLKIRGQKTVRSVAENNFSRFHIRRYNRWTCTYFSRVIQDKKTIDISEEDLNELRLKIDNVSVRLDEAFFKSSGKDELGAYWTLGFMIAGESIELGLHKQPAWTYTKTGLYDYQCERNLQPLESIDPILTNSEEQMRLSLESWVEKPE